jgi:hypothetical protein
LRVRDCVAVSIGALLYTRIYRSAMAA